MWRHLSGVSSDIWMTFIHADNTWMTHTHCKHCFTREIFKVLQIKIIPLFLLTAQSQGRHQTRQQSHEPSRANDHPDGQRHETGGGVSPMEGKHAQETKVSIRPWTTTKKATPLAYYSKINIFSNRQFQRRHIQSHVGHQEAWPEQASER